MLSFHQILDYLYCMYSKKQISALKKCHKEKSFGKFFGACNDYKSELDQCYRKVVHTYKLFNMTSFCFCFCPTDCFNNMITYSIHVI